MPAKLLPFPRSDLRRTLKTPKDIDRAIRVAAFGENRRVDVGKALVTTDEGQADRYFINVAGFGANGDVVEKTNKESNSKNKQKASTKQAKTNNGLSTKKKKATGSYTNQDGQPSRSSTGLSCTNIFYSLFLVSQTYNIPLHLWFSAHTEFPALLF